MSGVLDDEPTRTPEFRDLPHSAELLKQMNELLARFELDVPAADPIPHLFVFGLPRSGTTLASQLLALSLDVGFINNLIARFWLAPVFGIALSQQVLGGQRDKTLSSKLGRSTEPAGPHEFSFFWRHWLGIRSAKDLVDFESDGQRIEWSALVQELRRIAAAFERPMLYKTNYAGQFVGGFAEHMDQPVFIYVRRDPEDVAVSIYRARRSYYGSVDHWWGTLSPSYFGMESQTPIEQVARQVDELAEIYATKLASLRSGLVVKVDYRELCESPAGVIDAVRHRVRAEYGHELRGLNDPPEQIAFSSHVEKGDLSEVEKSLVELVRERMM